MGEHGMFTKTRVFVVSAELAGHTIIFLSQFSHFATLIAHGLLLAGSATALLVTILGQSNSRKPKAKRRKGDLNRLDSVVQLNLGRSVRNDKREGRKPSRIIAAKSGAAGANRRVRQCRICRCNEDRACTNRCTLIDSDLCSACALVDPTLIITEYGREELREYEESAVRIR